MAGIVRVEVVNSCAATRPVLASLRTHSRLQQVAPGVYEARVEGAEDARGAADALAKALERDVTPDWDEVVSLSPGDA